VLIIALALTLIAAVGCGVAYTVRRHQIARTGAG
jgi:hypothetical protein